MCKTRTATQTVVDRGIIMNAKNVTQFLQCMDDRVGTMFRCTVHTSARSVTCFLLDEKPLPSTYMRNILVYQFVRYLLLIWCKIDHAVNHVNKFNSLKHLILTFKFVLSLRQEFCDC